VTDLRDKVARDALRKKIKPVELSEHRQVIHDALDALDALDAERERERTEWASIQAALSEMPEWEHTQHLVSDRARELLALASQAKINESYGWKAWRGTCRWHAFWRWMTRCA
jgi:hypothetical protein